jgi:surface polysaccharide O-acyltransferase-like enzyme
MYIREFALEYIFVGISLIILLCIPRYAKIFWHIESRASMGLNKNSSRLQIIDTIRGMSIIAVILIHSCYLLLYKYNSTLDVIILNFINNISRFAIPVFFFTSGLLLKKFVWNKKYIFNFYFSKFIRIGIPYILVNITLWLIGYNNSTPLWKFIITGNMEVPFYFIPVLFQLYILYPVLDYMRQISPQYLLLGSLIISVISFFIPPTWALYDFPLFTQYLIFFVYGMLRQDVLNNKISNIWVELIIIYLFLQSIFITSMIYINTDINIFRLFYLYNFQIILGFGFIFTILGYLQSNKPGSKFMQYFFAPIGRLSLWIFLLHFPINQILFTKIINSDIYLAYGLIHNFILTLIISLFLSFVLAKIYLIHKTIKLILVKK